MMAIYCSANIRCWQSSVYCCRKYHSPYVQKYTGWIYLFAAYFAFDIAYPKQLYFIFTFYFYKTIGIQMPNIVSITQLLPLKNLDFYFITSHLYHILYLNKILDFIILNFI